MPARRRGGREDGRVAKPRVRSPLRHEQAARPSPITLLSRVPDTWSWQLPACWRGAGWVLVRPLRMPRAGNRNATPHKPIGKPAFVALEDLPPLAGVKLVRPHCCAAAGAPV